MAAEDDARIAEIRAWFDERGYGLYVHEIEGHGWRAPYIPKDSPIGSADYGVGDSPLAAAQDAQARLDRREIKVEDTMKVTDYAVVVKVEGEDAREISPESLVCDRRLGDPEVTSEAVEKLTTYGWQVVFEDEPDGKVTGFLLDRDTGDLLKIAVGDDFHDAWVELAIDTYPPSQELRRDREERQSQPDD